MALLRNLDGGRRITDNTTKMINATVKLRTHNTNNKDNDLDVFIPSWSFVLTKQAASDVSDATSITESEIEALILLDALSPGLELLSRMRDVGHRGGLVNLVVDWGCVSVVKFFSAFLIIHYPCLALNIVRCFIHSWSNWISDSSARVIRMIQPSASPMSLTKIAELAFWECRAILSNSVKVAQLLREFGKKMVIGVVDEKVVKDLRAQAAGTSEFQTLVSYICDMYVSNSTSLSDEQADHESRLSRVKSKSAVFYWPAGGVPCRIVKEKERPSDESITAELQALVDAVLSCVKTGNLSRWMSMGPSIAALLLLRWVSPKLTSNVFQLCSKKHEGEMLMHIGGGEFIAEGQIVHAQGTLKTYISSMFSIMMMTAAPDAATKMARKTVGKVPKHTNSEIDAAWVKEFDSMVSRKWRSGKVFCALMRQLDMGLSGRECMLTYGAWCLGYCTQWGQFCNQQGNEKLKSYPPQLKHVLGEAVELCDYDFEQDEFETWMRGLHGDEPITLEQELGFRSMTQTIVDDVAECTTNEDRRAVLQSWEMSTEALAEHGARDAYAVRFIFFSSGGAGAR